MTTAGEMTAKRPNLGRPLLRWPIPKADIRLHIFDGSDWCKCSGHFSVAFPRDRTQDALTRQHGATSPVLEARVANRLDELQFHIGHKFDPWAGATHVRPEMCVDGLYSKDLLP